ncbi:Protein of unknown function DUF2303 [Nitrosomonas sp. Is79A3]|uniref:DUF2303 family protein n=1 Tax=Nitrosomonas sp. (strain Is79A3) TaxID=261292 RepID=UPI000215CADE
MESLETKASETQAIIDLASSITPIEIAGQDHMKRVALPPGWKLEEKDDEKLLPQPMRKKGTVNLDDVDSYIGYINRHKSLESTVIYVIANYVSGAVHFKCIINDHEAYLGTSPTQDWKDFVAFYEPRKSVEWDRWNVKNKEPFSQFEFALFLEDNLQDIAAVEGMPTAQQLLEMATKFQATMDMRYKSNIRTQSGGMNLTFVNDDDAQTVETMKLFEKISIGIPVFWGGAAYRIDARLRYRAKDGGLKFWYELIREDKVMEDATKTMIDKIKADTGVPLFFGRP